MPTAPIQPSASTVPASVPSSRRARCRHSAAKTPNSKLKTVPPASAPALPPPTQNSKPETLNCGGSAAARTGKIARLPVEIRESLNRRLDDGEPAASLLVWLNGLPKVRGVLQRLFEGRPVTPSNLSDWRAGGYADWQRACAARASLQALFGQVSIAGEATPRNFSSSLHAYASARVVQELATADLLPSGPERSRLVLACVQSLARLSTSRLAAVRADRAQNEGSSAQSPTPWEELAAIRASAAARVKRMLAGETVEPDDDDYDYEHTFPMPGSSVAAALPPPPVPAAAPAPKLPPAAPSAAVPAAPAAASLSASPPAPKPVPAVPAPVAPVAGNSFGPPPQPLSDFLTWGEPGYDPLVPRLRAPRPSATRA